MLVSASILGIKDRKKRHIRELNKTKTDYIHLDIMDGLLVANKNDEFSHLKHLVKASKYPTDIHLMVKDVIKYVDMYKQLKPLYLTFHIEATDNPLTMIDYIKNNHIKVGISINPHTPLEKLQDYLECIDLVLVMTVEPGEGGQPFVEESANKIKLLKQIREEKGYHYVIEVDGGINVDTALRCSDADILVIGSFITNSDNYSKQINIIKDLFK